MSRSSRGRLPEAFVRWSDPGNRWPARCRLDAAPAVWLAAIPWDDPRPGRRRFRRLPRQRLKRWRRFALPGRANVRVAKLLAEGTTNRRAGARMSAALPTTDGTLSSARTPGFCEPDRTGGTNFTPPARRPRRGNEEPRPRTHCRDWRASPSSARPRAAFPRSL
jgi:hypothetical protein